MLRDSIHHLLGKLRASKSRRTKAKPRKIKLTMALDSETFLARDVMPKPTTGGRSKAKDGQ